MRRFFLQTDVWLLVECALLLFRLSLVLFGMEDFGSGLYFSSEAAMVAPLSDGDEAELLLADTSLLSPADPLPMLTGDDEGSLLEW